MPIREKEPKRLEVERKVIIREARRHSQPKVSEQLMSNYLHDRRSILFLPCKNEESADATNTTE